MTKIPVLYISIWDGDEIVTKATLIEETGEVTDIEAVDIGNAYNTCEGEFIEYPSGERVPVLESGDSYFLASVIHQQLIDLLDAIIGDLREFESEGYPTYLKQMKKANTGDSEGLYDLLDVVGQILEDLEEHQSENVPMYRQQLEKLADDIG